MSYSYLIIVFKQNCIFYNLTILNWANTTHMLPSKLLYFTQYFKKIYYFFNKIFSFSGKVFFIHSSPLSNPHTCIARTGMEIFYHTLVFSLLPYLSWVSFPFFQFLILFKSENLWCVYSVCDLQYKKRGLKNS